jgi:hypothetical protein
VLEATWTPAAHQPFDAITSHLPNEENEWTAEISCDGLRLIFGQGPRDGRDRIYTAQRPSIADPFSTPTLHLFSNVMVDGDPSLSEDGHEIYFVGGGATHACIYVARRADEATPSWTTPTQVLDCDASGAQLSGPYLTRDGLRLYYHESDDAGNQAIRMASRTSTANDFLARGTPVSWEPPGAKPDAGFCALSNDELAIYCENGNPSHVVQSTRTSRTAAFGNTTAVPGIPVLNDQNIEISTGDPEIGGHGRLLVYGSTTVGADPATSFSHLRLAERSCQ